MCVHESNLRHADYLQQDGKSNLDDVACEACGQYAGLPSELRQRLIMSRNVLFSAN
jgi:hypothetical protein